MLGIRRYRGVAIDLYQGDIHDFACDIIVSAGSSPSSLGSSAAGRLPCKHVIQAPAPVWQGGGQGEAALLAQAYQSCLSQAVALKERHIAFPGLSIDGEQGYPLPAAASVAMEAIQHFLQSAAPSKLGRITFVLHDSATYQHFQKQMFMAFPEDGSR